MSDAKPVILHVDDDEANRYAVTRSLIKAGFEVIEAATGQEALSKVTASPDLVILDVRLPDINGFEVCQRIKSDPQTAHIPVLHLSASFVSGTDKAHGLNIGADAYLVRPVEPAELIATVNALLRAKRSEDALRKSEEQNRELIDSLQAAAKDREKLLHSEQSARADAERASVMKDEFLATLSHELRTPLNAILGWTTILRRPNISERELRDGLNVIERNAKSQTKIIEDLLDMSRIIAGKVRLDVQPVELSTVLEEAINSIRPAAEAKNIELKTDLKADASSMSGDVSRLAQIFWNLLTNAVKFTPKGGVVEINSRRTNSQLEVSVKDSGEGIAKNFLPHVFERFRQADASTTRRHGGLGLGLSIVKQLAEMHGGAVRVESDGPGTGAMFTVSFPILALKSVGETDANAGGKSSLEKVSPIGNCEDINGIRVLVVDDETDAREMIRHLLEHCNAIVKTASSASEALADLMQHRPDVIISDIGMPGEDGYMLIRRIRSLSPQLGGLTPAIALTAYARTEDRTTSFLAGFQMHLAKPVEPDELISTVAHLAASRSRDRLKN